MAQIHQNQLLHLSPNCFLSTESNQLKPVKILISPQKMKFISIKTPNSKQNLDSHFIFSSTHARTNVIYHTYYQTLQIIYTFQTFKHSNVKRKEVHLKRFFKLFQLETISHYKKSEQLRRQNNVGERCVAVDHLSPTHEMLRRENSKIKFNAFIFCDAHNGTSR